MKQAMFFYLKRTRKECFADRLLKGFTIALLIYAAICFFKS
jgi:hypothetical protein